MKRIRASRLADQASWSTTSRAFNHLGSIKYLSNPGAINPVFTDARQFGPPPKERKKQLWPRRISGSQIGKQPAKKGMSGSCRPTSPISLGVKRLRDLRPAVNRQKRHHLNVFRYLLVPISGPRYNRPTRSFRKHLKKLPRHPGANQSPTSGPTNRSLVPG